MVSGRKRKEKLNPENPATSPVFLRLFKDCKIGWWTSIILTVVFTSVYICVYKVAVRIIFIYSTRGASDSAEDIYNNNDGSAAR